MFLNCLVRDSLLARNPPTFVVSNTRVRGIADRGAGVIGGTRLIWFGLGLTNRFVLVRGAASMPTAQAASFETRFAGAGSLETSRMMSTHDADLDWLAGRALSDGTTRTHPVALRYVTSRHVASRHSASPRGTSPELRPRPNMIPAEHDPGRV